MVAEVPFEGPNDGEERDEDASADNSAQTGGEEDEDLPG